MTKQQKIDLLALLSIYYDDCLAPLPASYHLDLTNKIGDVHTLIYQSLIMDGMSGVDVYKTEEARKAELLPKGE